jgi:hypothetical protein
MDAHVDLRYNFDIVRHVRRMRMFSIALRMFLTDTEKNIAGFIS